MLESNLRTVGDDVRVLLKDAQILFQSAADLTGEKADEARARGTAMLNAALAKANDVSVRVCATGREMSDLVDERVKSNPWNFIAMAGMLGLTIGLVVGRK